MNQRRRFSSTAVFIKVNVNHNCFLIKLLSPEEKSKQGQNVVFLQHVVLTHTRVAVFKAEIKLIGNTMGLSGWPYLTDKN
jgi:hypothetical protein